MRRILKKLLMGGGGRVEGYADLATADWSPVPLSATAQVDNIVGWLQEPDPVPARRPAASPAPRARRKTIRRMFKKIKDYMDHLTPEERRIVEEQKQLDAQPVAARSPVVSRPAPAPQAAPVSRRAPVSQAPESDWVEVLKSYGEHLTDEELRIIRKQMD